MNRTLSNLQIWFQWYVHPFLRRFWFWVVVAYWIVAAALGTLLITNHLVLRTLPRPEQVLFTYYLKQQLDRPNGAFVCYPICFTPVEGNRLGIRITALSQ